MRNIKGPPGRTPAQLELRGIILAFSRPGRQRTKTARNGSNGSLFVQVAYQCNFYAVLLQDVPQCRLQHIEICSLNGLERRKREAWIVVGHNLRHSDPERRCRTSV